MATVRVIRPGFELYECLLVINIITITMLETVLEHNSITKDSKVQWVTLYLSLKLKF